MICILFFFIFNIALLNLKRKYTVFPSSCINITISDIDGYKMKEYSFVDSKKESFLLFSNEEMKFSKAMFYYLSYSRWVYICRGDYPYELGYLNFSYTIPSKKINEFVYLLFSDDLSLSGAKFDKRNFHENVIFNHKNDPIKLNKEYSRIYKNINRFILCDVQNLEKCTDTTVEKNSEKIRIRTPKLNINEYSDYFEVKLYGATANYIVFILWTNILTREEMTTRFRIFLDLPTSISLQKHVITFNQYSGTFQETEIYIAFEDKLTLCKESKKDWKIVGAEADIYKIDDLGFTWNYPYLTFYESHFEYATIKIACIEKYMKTPSKRLIFLDLINVKIIDYEDLQNFEIRYTYHYNASMFPVNNKFLSLDLKNYPAYLLYLVLFISSAIVFLSIVGLISKKYRKIVNSVNKYKALSNGKRDVDSKRLLVKYYS